MSAINERVSDTTIAEILSGVIEGVEPTTHEISMARELKQHRAAAIGEPSTEAMERAFREYCAIPNVREGLLQMWRTLRDDVINNTLPGGEDPQLKK